MVVPTARPTVRVKVFAIRQPCAVIVSLFIILVGLADLDRFLRESITTKTREIPLVANVSNIRVEARCSGTMHQQQSRPRVSLLRNQTGSWLGDTWIPPPTWQLYSGRELRRLFHNRTVLWIGDSLARRAASSMYAIINSTDIDLSRDALDNATVIDGTKRGKDLHPDCPRPKMLRSTGAFSIRACWSMPNSFGRHRGPTTKFMIQSGPRCVADIYNVMKHELDGTSQLTSVADLVVLSLGSWDVKDICVGHHSEDSFATSELLLDSMVDLLYNVSALRQIPIMWRTLGLSEDGNTWPTTLDLNARVMQRIDALHAQNDQFNPLVYVNWADAVLPRAMGVNRIRGDLPPHFGLEPRLVMIQMLSNALVQYFGWKVS